MDQIALDFSKKRRYLREHYKELKDGKRIKSLEKPRSLQKVIKEFIEIEDVGMFAIEFFAHNYLNSIQFIFQC